MIYDEYQAVAREYAAAPCLKMDCWNEAESDHPIAPLLPGCVCLELDPARVERARVKFPGIDFRVGSIEALPFADGSFARVFDFSTIDHLADFRPALDEYRRVLTPDGLLILVAWLIDGRTQSERTRWGGMQYYYEAAPFAAEVARRFTIERHEEFSSQRFGPYHLDLFVCRGNI